MKIILKINIGNWTNHFVFPIKLRPKTSTSIPRSGIDKDFIMKAFSLPPSVARCMALALLISSAALGALPSAYADSLGDIKQSKVMKIGVFQDYPPFGSIGADMKPRGIDVDLAAVLAKKLGARRARTGDRH
ncbi:transporter substrate-binding domain-containing protein [Caballeronia sp. SEWSISQ10-4 2]|uniref:transporter substrate-binding domain-containing protein n=1 Tax=Caballeronia sp. SEWSISQ10-4 2 TaxID=2937438 RepID=UPI00264E9D0F|nr:transporter substrate-binding domain-containing protein [Caballeronia sp. SEWSISQ10-4 2]MDN7179595.1 transporter substrate-binding domain-containing protein [Caballeronia sp. SEWSISQ10-4 2]